MLDQQVIDTLRKYQGCYETWKQHQVFAGFGHEGVSAIASAYASLTGMRLNTSCTSCLTKVTDIVYKELEKYDTNQTHP